MFDSQFEGIRGGGFQAVFLNIVEPNGLDVNGSDRGGIRRILAACEPLYRELHGQRDSEGRPLFSPYFYLKYWGGQLGRCAEKITLHREDHGYHLKLPPYSYYESMVIGTALGSWADPKLAATFLDEFRSFAHPTMPRAQLGTVASLWATNWQDHDKKRAFKAEVARIGGAAPYWEEGAEARVPSAPPAASLVVYGPNPRHPAVYGPNPRHTA